MPREKDDITDKNFYSYKKQVWHGKGIVGEIEESAMSVYERMTPVRFEQRPFSITLNGEVYETGKHYGIVRIAEKEVVIGQTKGRYVLTQPKRYAELFDQYVGKPVETMGFLGTHGKRMFTTWVLPQVDVHGDKVDMFGLLAAGFDGAFGEQIYETGVRVVCRNTFNKAISNSDEKFKGAVYSGRHTEKDHEETLGIWMQYVTQQAEENVEVYQKLFRKMEETPITTDKAYNLFSQVYYLKDSIGSYYPDQLRTKDQGTIDDFNQDQMKKRDLALSLFSDAGIEITPTVYGVYNSVTELENHHIKSKKDSTESILFGDRQNVMENAFNIMSEYVEVR